MDRFTYLFNRYVGKKADAAERLEFQEALTDHQYDQQLSDLIDSYLAAYEPDSAVEALGGGDELLAAILVRDPSGLVRTTTTRVRRLWVPAAAVALLIVAIMGIWMLPGDQTGTLQSEIHSTHEILPGGNRATLTLADGRKIDLRTDQSGIMIGEDIKYADGSLLFDADHTPSGVADELVLTTPTGGTYFVILPDGSKVWLNAESTLRYPSRFDRDSRFVELEGEAYFSVLSLFQPAIGQDEAKRAVPFRVVTNGQAIDVLGTEFNVSAYAGDDEITTTLIEGKIGLSPGRELSGAQLLRQEQTILMPGQQATTRDGVTTVRSVDVSRFVAWKDGLFDFTDRSLHDVMSQLERWYDIEVVYEGYIPEMEFFGKIYRDKNLSEVLEILKSAQINFRLTENRKLIIYK